MRDTDIDQIDADPWLEFDARKIDRSPVAVRMGSIGIWSRVLQAGKNATIQHCAKVIEDLGFTAMWIPELPRGGGLRSVELALRSTTDVVVVAGMLNIGLHKALEVDAWVNQARLMHSGRFLVSFDASQAAAPGARKAGENPTLSALHKFLDELSTNTDHLPSEFLVVSRENEDLGIAGRATLGALMSWSDGRRLQESRALLGNSPLLAIELKVSFEKDPVKARAQARAVIGPGLALGHYSRSLLRHGFTQQDFENGGSDRLIDGLCVWGSPDNLVGRIQAMLDAGVDHVCLQAIDSSNPDDLIATWSVIARDVMPNVSSRTISNVPAS